LRALTEPHKGGSFSPQVNLYGAVLGFTSPTLTKAHDWQINIALVDESTHLPTTDERNEDVASTTAVIFCRERDQLPRLVQAETFCGCILSVFRYVYMVDVLLNGAFQNGSHICV
jgi:hypothetical protein